MEKRVDSKLSYDKCFVEPDNYGVYCLATNDIEVSVIPQHRPEESSPEENIFSFSYFVFIKNNSPATVQLLERHWIIKSAGVQIAEIIGPGVVGCKPVLESGSAFEYSSRAIITDCYGSMEGSYTFHSTDGSFFDVLIPRFDLLYPLTIH